MPKYQTFKLGAGSQSLVYAATTGQDGDCEKLPLLYEQTSMQYSNIWRLDH